MTTVLVTGAKGQVGTALQEIEWKDGTNLIALSSRDLDITDRAAVHQVVEDCSPSVVINAAAYTSVDAAEDDEDAAYEVNATAVGHLAQAATRSHAMFIHLSTDYVFDGQKDGWYLETDATNPISAYGRTKLAGEQAASEAGNCIILRTSWVYSATGSNFVKTIRRLALERSEIGVVSDQNGCPTSAMDIAKATAQVVERSRWGKVASPHRLYHLAAPDDTTWFGLATAVLMHSAARSSVVCKPIPASAYKVAATRPQNSKLDSALITRDFGIELPPWEDSLKVVLADLDRNQ